MKIVVIGCGKVGKSIVQRLCNEGNEISIIDTSSDVINEMVETFDVSGVVGNGATLECQNMLIDSKTDIVIATTPLDELNILACVSAKKLGAFKTIARIRKHDYYKEINWFKNEFGIDFIVNPELETALEIRNTINFPEAVRIDSLCHGKVDLVEFYIEENNLLVGKSLTSINKEFGVQILVCAVERKGNVFIPDGSYVFQAEDRVHVTASRTMIKQFFHKIGLIDNKIRKVLIIGGGIIGVYLAEELTKAKYEVKIVESNHDTCLAITEDVPSAEVVYGDGSSQELLDSEGLSDMDAVVCLTGLDEQNIIIGMYAAQKNIGKIVIKVNKGSLDKMLSSLGNFSVVSPKSIAASKMISYARSNSFKANNKVDALYTIVDNQVEVSEFTADESSKILNVELKDMKENIKKGVLLAAILRDDQVIIPNGTDSIMQGDKVIVVSSKVTIDELDDIIK